MGKRGPRPKPTAVRLFEGNRVQRPTDRSEEPIPPSGDLPVAPEWLGDYGRAEWVRAAPLLHAVGCLTEVDQSLFAQYCQAWDDFHSALADIRKLGISIDTEKGRISNPAIKAKYLASGLIVKIGGMFGMAPAARVGLAAAQQDPEHDDLANFKRGTA